MPFRPCRVLLTGGTGFLGGHLARALLDEGCEVTAVVRAASGLAGLDLRAHRLVHDGSTEALVTLVREAAPEVAIHAATSFIAAHQPKDIVPLVSSNVLFGAQLLEALALSGVRRLVNCGTAWQHFDSDAYRPASLYAATKQAFEDLAAFYVDAAGLRVITLKLSDTYGPGDRRPKLVNLLRQAAASGDALPLSPGEQVLSFVHVSDAVEAVRIAMERTRTCPAKAEAFAVRGRELVSLRDFVRLCEAAAGRTIDVKWGARAYREREVMRPWLGPLLPDWTPRVGLEEGLRELFAHHV